MIIGQNFNTPNYKIGYGNKTKTAKKVVATTVNTVKKVKPNVKPKERGLLARILGPIDPEIEAQHKADVQFIKDTFNGKKDPKLAVFPY